MKTIAVEEIFNLRQETGGLHDLLGINNVQLDDKGRVTMDLNVSDKVLNPYGMAHGVV